MGYFDLVSDLFSHIFDLKNDRQSNNSTSIEIFKLAKRKIGFGYTDAFNVYQSLLGFLP